MAQDVYVTRAAHHTDGAQTPITERDWRAIIEKDPDLRAPDQALLSYSLWAGPTRMPSPWIDWANGNLFSRSPDQALLQKLIEVAETLGAQVQGQGGEIYRVEKDNVVRAEAVAGPAPARGGGPPEPAAPESPDLEAILGGEHPSVNDAPAPPAGPSSEALFGPRPRNAEGRSEADVSGAPVPADASFAPRDDEQVTLEPVASEPEPTIPFEVGQRVQTQWGRPATIVSIDCGANGGRGRIEIRYDDGRVATTDGSSHGLESSGL